MQFIYTLFGTVALLVAAQSGALACSNCLSVYSIETFTHLTNTVQAHVKVLNPPSGCVTVVTGTWTDPDGSTVTRNSIASGTRRRAEFPLHSTLTGTFVFTVDDINCGTGYDYQGNDSASVTIASSSPTNPTDPPSAAEECTTDCVFVSSIDMFTKSNKVKAKIVVVDENNNLLEGATVTATWTLPNGSTELQSKFTNRYGKAVLRMPEGSGGTFSIDVNDVRATGLTYDPDSSMLSSSITV